MRKKIIIGTIGLSFILCSGSAFANGYGWGYGGSYGGFYGGSSGVSSNGLSATSSLRERSFSINGYSTREASETATKYFRRGVKKFEANDLEAAGLAFESVLLARGPALDKMTYHYLVIINEKLGNQNKVEKYTEAYNSFQ